MVRPFTDAEFKAHTERVEAANRARIVDKHTTCAKRAVVSRAHAVPFVRCTTCLGQVHTDQFDDCLCTDRRWLLCVECAQAYSTAQPCACDVGVTQWQCEQERACAEYNQAVLDGGDRLPCVE